jgi:hypothetical protein
MELLATRLEEDGKAQRCGLRPIAFTHGDTFDPVSGRLGKALLVSRLQVLFDERLTDLPKGDPEAEAMARELRDYEIHVEPNANELYGAFKVGSHDDLVTALGLACLEDPTLYRIERGPRIW